MIFQVTENLFLKGRLKNKEQFLYDVGTGYYANVNNEQI